jgi:hypothetical protein
MLGSAIVEVAIGLVFIYILLSLLVSQINQVVANALKIRANQLRKRVERIVFDEELQKRIMAHPLVGIIQLPRRTDKSEAEVRTDDMETARVNRLAANTFAKAMINILSDPFLELYAALAMVKNEEERSYLQSIVNQLKANIADPARANAALTQLYETIQQLEPADRRDRKALLRTLSPLQSSLREMQAGNTGLLMLLDGVSRVENRAFQRAMETILSGVQNVKEAETAIESWFDQKMDQTSSWYGTTMQTLSLIFGFMLAILLNIDTLHISLTLWNDSTLRESIASTARAADFSQFFDDEGNLITVPSVVGVEPSTDESAIPDDDGTQDLIASYEAAQATLNQLLALRLPIGWTFRTPGSVQDIQVSDGVTIDIYDPLSDDRNLYRLFAVTSPGWFGFVAGKLLGLLITAIAIAQGAPFWFDILRRIAGQRSPSAPAVPSDV